METTPNDLRQQQFEIKFRGYNPDDVEVFRDLAATALEEARAEILKLTEENNHLRERLEHLVSIEETLKAAVLEAQKNADNTLATAKKQAETTVDSARKEADLILREARRKGEEMTLEAHQRMAKLVNDINKIRFIRSNYLSRLKTLLESQTQALDEELSEDEREERATRDFESRQPRVKRSDPTEAPVETPVQDEYRDEDRRREEEPDEEVLMDDEQEEMHDAIDRAFQEGPAMRPEEAPSDEGPPESAADESGHESRHEDDDDTWKKLKEHLGED